MHPAVQIQRKTDGILIKKTAAAKKKPTQPNKMQIQSLAS